MIAVLGLVLGGAVGVSESKAAKAPRAPGATTGNADHVTATSATLHGRVNPRSLATTYYFQYGSCEVCVGPGSPYTSQTPTQSAGSGKRTVSVSAAITGLSPAITVHYRIVATNSVGTIFGADRTFRPLGGSPEQTNPVVQPHRGRVHTTFTLSFTPQHDLGVSGAIKSDYRVNITGPKPACNESVEITQGTHGHRIRELFGPPTAVGWCVGGYRGEVLYQEGPFCAPTAGKVCPLVASRQVDAGHFSFRARRRHHHHHRRHHRHHH